MGFIYPFDVSYKTCHLLNTFDSRWWTILFWKSYKIDKFNKTKRQVAVKSCQNSKAQHQDPELCGRSIDLQSTMTLSSRAPRIDR